MKPLYIYCSHHRCATTWTQSIIIEICDLINLEYQNEAGYHVIPINLEDIDFFSHVNSTFDIFERLNSTPYRGFHVIRDPRDILISAYFSAKYSHPVYSDAFAEHREKLISKDIKQGLLLELGRRKAEFEAMQEWEYENPNVYETRFEVLTVQPLEEFIRIIGFLEIPYTSNPVDYYSTSFALFSNRILKRFGRIGPITPPTSGSKKWGTI